MLTLPDIRAYCISKRGAREDFPFDFRTLVFKVGGKLFALTNIDEPVVSLNLKCDPYLSLELRSRYPQVTPGYHMNKKHWNTVIIDGAIPDAKILEMIDHSYNIVFRALNKATRESIGQ